MTSGDASEGFLTRSSDARPRGKRVRFVQFADTHIAAGAMASDIRSAFARACALAVDRKADIVLAPGDLFDYETADPDTAAFISQTLAQIAPIPVFIAPGNHDSLRPRSPYFEKWPENVHIFTAPEFETMPLPDLDCSITGVAHAHRGITDRLLAPPIAAPQITHTRFLLFHGSRDGYRPSDKENVIPFSDAELLAQGFTYCAIGHYHSYAEIANDESIRAAYSGCIQGRGLDETGEKCALVGEIDPEGRVTLEKVEVAQRRIVRVDVDATGARDSADLFARIDESLLQHARKQDAVYVFVRGLLPSGIEIDTDAWESRQPYFTTSLSLSGAVPDYDLDSICRESAASPLRSAFVAKMLEKQQAASDEDERHTLRDAMYYGLFALDNRRLEPRDVD